MDELQDQEKERADQVASTVRALKTIADVSAGKGDPARLAASVVVRGIKAIKNNDQQEKSASSIESPIAVAALAERRLGSHWVDYERESLRDIGLNDLQIDKAMSVKIALYEPKAFTDWGYFHRLARAFNGHTSDGDLMYDLTLAELAWAVDVMRYLDGLTPWGEEVSGYVAAVAHSEGFVVLPKILEFASGSLGHITSSVGQVVSDRFRRGVDDEATREQKNKLKALQHFVNTRHRDLRTQLEGVK